MSKPEFLTSKVEPLIIKLKEDQFFETLKNRVKNLIYPTGVNYHNSPHKRGLDIIGSLILLPPALIPMGIAAIFIKLEDGGPIFYIADGIAGKDFKQFAMIKLRSMKVGPSSTDGPRLSNDSFFKTPDDSRITRVGKVIRKLTIDELPQLINVLRGEMSLVGNRPMFPNRIAYIGTIPEVSDIYPEWYNSYPKAKPGMASLATIHGRSILDQSIEGHRIRMTDDVIYIARGSLVSDFKIIVGVMQAVLSRRGAC